MIRTKRIYERPESSDGYRILVDRLWPRGVSKSTAKIDLWLRDIAPSAELRKWYSHDPNKWQAFQRRYRKELEPKPELLRKIKMLSKRNKRLTLLFSSKETKLNNAAALRQFLSN